MTNKPLSSGDQVKVFIFTLLMVPPALFGIGSLPAIFLIFGLFMMRKNEDFSSIETTVKYFEGYLWIMIVGCVIAASYWCADYLLEDHYLKTYSLANFVGFMIGSAISLTYLVLVHILFLSPLKSHSEWVAVNGIFSRNPKSTKQSSAASGLNIIKGENLKHYSVADELMKWAKLKEGGDIFEEEFNDARKNP